MGWIGWIILGGHAGWVANMIMKEDGGLLKNIVLGVIGGVVGGGAGYLYGRHRVKKYPNRHYTTKTKVKH